VAISYATIDKEKYDESEYESMKKEISFLKNHGTYYKGTQDSVTKFIEGILEEAKNHL